MRRKKRRRRGGQKGRQEGRREGKKVESWLRGQNCVEQTSETASRGLTEGTQHCHLSLFLVLLPGQLLVQAWLALDIPER